MNKQPTVVAVVVLSAAKQKSSQLHYLYDPEHQFTYICTKKQNISLYVFCAYLFISYAFLYKLSKILGI